MRTGLVKVTVTPGVRAPVLSLTLPVMLPVCRDWARATGERAVISRRVAIHLIEIASTRVRVPPGKAGLRIYSGSAGGGARHGDRIGPFMNEGVHHPAAAVVEMPLDGRAGSFRIAPLDRIHDRVVLAARRRLERGIVDAEGDEPRHLGETMPDEGRNDRVAAGLGHREMERAVRLGGVAEAGGV